MGGEVTIISQTKGLVKETTQYLAATIISGVALVVQGFLVARVLGPTIYGVWNILMVVFTYTAYAHLGIVHGMNKEIPLLRGKGSPAQAERVRDNTFWSVFILAVAVSLALLTGSLVWASRFSPEVIGGVRILAALAILQQIYIFLTSLLRADKRFGLMSFSIASLSLASLLFLLVLFNLPINKLYAALLALLLAYLLLDVFILRQAKYKLKPSLDLTVVRGTFMVGLPLILLNIGYVIFISVDRWVIAGTLDPTNLGYYGMALSLANFLFAASSVVAFVLYPRMLERYAETGEAASSEHLVIPPLTITSYAMVLVCALTVFFVPLLIYYLLPAYQSSIEVASILILGVYFLCVQTIPANYLISIDKQNKILGVQAIAIVVVLGMDYAAIKAGWGLRGVALATSIAYLGYGTAIITFALGRFHQGLGALLRHLGKLYLPFGVSLPVIFLLLQVIKMPRISLWSDALVVVMQMAIFLALAAVPVCYWLKRSKSREPR